MTRLTTSPFLLVFLLTGCGAEPVRDVVREEPEPAEARPSGADRSGYPKIVAFGDSLTAGLGVGKDEAYPAALQEILDESGYDFEVVNAGVSGETSAGGVRRLSWVLEDRDVAVLILELGANDGLRGLPPSEMKKNLSEILAEAEARGIPVLLAGLSASGGSGDGSVDRYVREFVTVYEELADEHDVVFMPHFLDGVAGNSELNQPDGKHPNPAGARKVAENVWRVLQPMLVLDALHGSERGTPAESTP